MEQPPDPTKERDERNEAISKVILAKDVTLMQMDKLSEQFGKLHFSTGHPPLDILRNSFFKIPNFTASVSDENLVTRIFNIS